MNTVQLTISHEEELLKIAPSCSANERRCSQPVVICLNGRNPLMKLAVFDAVQDPLRIEEEEIKDVPATCSRQFGRSKPLSCLGCVLVEAACRTCLLLPHTESHWDERTRTGRHPILPNRQASLQLPSPEPTLSSRLEVVVCRTCYPIHHTRYRLDGRTGA